MGDGSRIANRLLLLGGCVLLTCAGAKAQTDLMILGNVTDATGAAVPGATVDLQSSDGKTVAEAHSGAKGGFTLKSVAPGDYTVYVPAALGFAAQSLPLHLTGSVSDLKISLAPASVKDSISVGEDQALSADAASNKDTITESEDQLRKLPVFDQNYIAALTPFLDAFSGSSGGATIIVDGVEMKASAVSASAIQEVRINNDPYSSEFNRPGRGRIEIITKPGSPDFHGELNFLFRDAAFNAKNYFAPVRPPEQRRIYEGHLSGPVGTGGHTNFIAVRRSRQRRGHCNRMSTRLVRMGWCDTNVATPLALHADIDACDA